MALFNYATKEIILKIVYYGPGLSGKTTNLEVLHKTFSPGSVGKLISLSTETDRTLFFDFLPVELGKIKDFTLRFQLYTVPGQVRYNSTRKLVLKGADAVVFVADSQRTMKEQNIESFENMRANLIENNIDPDSIPIVLQYNKRDLEDILSVQELNTILNSRWYPYIEAIAINGRGVKETFEAIIRLLLKNISQKYSIEVEDKKDREAPSTLVKERGDEGEVYQRTPDVDFKQQLQMLSNRFEDIYNEVKQLNNKIERIERLITERQEKKEEPFIENLEKQITQIQKTLTDMGKSQREMLIQLKTVYDILGKARLEKKGIFF